MNSNIKIESILSDSSQSALGSISTLHRANDLLQQAVKTMEPLELQSLSLSWRMIHLGKGLYAEGDRAGLHVHDQLHLESVLSGRFKFGHDSGEILRTPGQSLWVVPQCRHSWECISSGYMMGGLVNVVGPAQAELFAAMQGKHGGPAVLSPATCTVWYRELLCLLTRPDPPIWRVQSVSSLLRLLLADLLSGLVDFSDWSPITPTADQDTRYSDLCRRAMEFLEANYAQPVQVEDVSLQVGISPRHLGRLFRQHYGDSVSHALNQIRLNNARKMLLERHDMSIKQIAFATGFSRPAYFTACFRKEYGISPRDARK